MPLIYVDKSAERGFVRRALAAFPKEYIEAIWGIRKGPNVYVHSFQHLDHSATTGQAEYASFEICEEEKVLEKYPDGMDEHAESAKQEGVRVLGKIHSHPWEDPDEFDKQDDYPSEGDLEEDSSEGSVVTGICLIRKHQNGRKYVTVSYWPLLKRLTKKFYD